MAFDYKKEYKEFYMPKNKPSNHPEDKNRTEMNYNERKFNMDIAAVCGLREAVIVDFIRGWLLTSDETTYRHGHLWVKCTQKTMTVHLPFLTEDMVRYSIRRLVKKGIIKVEKFSDYKFDHTYWYTFTAYGEELLDDGVCIE